VRPEAWKARPSAKTAIGGIALSVVWTTKSGLTLFTSTWGSNDHRRTFLPGRVIVADGPYVPGFSTTAAPIPRSRPTNAV